MWRWHNKIIKTQASLSKTLAIVITLVLLTSCDVMGLSKFWDIMSCQSYYWTLPLTLFAFAWVSLLWLRLTFLQVSKASEEHSGRARADADSFTKVKKSSSPLVLDIRDKSKITLDNISCEKALCMRYCFINIVRIEPEIC